VSDLMYYIVGNLINFISRYYILIAIILGAGMWRLGWYLGGLVG